MDKKTEVFIGLFKDLIENGSDNCEIQIDSKKAKIVFNVELIGFEPKGGTE